MLKRDKNELLSAIQREGLDIGDFDAAEEPTEHSLVFTITYKPAQLQFSVSHPHDDPDMFWYSYTRFTGRPNPPVTGPFPEEASDYADTAQVVRGLQTWLARDVSRAIEEELLPDLWQQARDSAIARIGQTHRDDEPFSPDERAQVKMAITNFYFLIEQTFSPAPEARAAVQEQLDYLKEAVDRLNRFDWKGTAINTLLGITVTLSLDTERGRQLYGLFRQAFAALVHLLR